MQPLGGLRLPKFLERPRFELTHPLPGEPQGLSDLLEGMFLLAGQPVAQPQDQLLPGRQGADQGSHTCSHAIIVDSAIGEIRRLVGYEVLEAFFGTCNIRFQGDGFPRKTVQGLQGIGIGSECRCQFGRRRIASQFPSQLGSYALAALESIMYVRGQADRPRVILYCAYQCLPNPPDGIGREFESPPMIEFLHGSDQPKIPLLDEIGKGEAQISVVFGDCDDELQVVLDEALVSSSICLRVTPTSRSSSANLFVRLRVLFISRA